MSHICKTRSKWRQTLVPEARSKGDDGYTQKRMIFNFSEVVGIGRPPGLNWLEMHEPESPKQEQPV
ncbi:MAG TPA: hypothetical protein VN281_01855 [Verrucomicrobiae bacterium]|nr:hypothetical protein [Verrucomicrobiae bacterium]